jgi:hypothetical protein
MARDGNCQIKGNRDQANYVTIPLPSPVAAGSFGDWKIRDP